MEGKLIVALVEENVSGEETKDSLQYTKLDLYNDEELDNGFNEILSHHDLSESEKMVRNLREKSAILTNLLKPGFEISYAYPPRPKFEVFGGYKIAKRRQASLNADFSKVKVYNLYFRFSNKDLNNLYTSALMYKNQHEEVILLSPQNTQQEIERVTTFYRDVSSKMLVREPGMNPDDQSNLLENLRLLTVNERCAQSLQHEYGHILHWRLFKFLGLEEPYEIYEWFYTNGYAELMNCRSPEFSGADVLDKLYLLKECLVEDYRIWLNVKEKSGMFILPNTNTYYGDFITPNLLEDGVKLMEEMLKPVINGSLRNDQTEKSSGEPSRIIRGDQIYKKALSTNWKPGSDLMSKEDHLQVIEDLKGLKNAKELTANQEHLQVMKELKKLRGQRKELSKKTLHKV